MRYKKKVPLPFLDRFLGTEKKGHSIDCIESIIRDVEALLNTRSTDPLGEPGGTVLEYGLPDMTARGRSETELWSLALKVKKSLEDFEPRLSQITVAPVTGLADEIDHFTVRITASVIGLEDRPPLRLEIPLPYH